MSIASSRKVDSGIFPALFPARGILDERANDSLRSLGPHGPLPPWRTIKDDGTDGEAREEESCLETFAALELKKQRERRFPSGAGRPAPRRC